MIEVKTLADLGSHLRWGNTTEEEQGVPGQGQKDWLRGRSLDNQTKEAQAS